MSGNSDNLIELGQRGFKSSCTHIGFFLKVVMPIVNCVNFVVVINVVKVCGCSYKSTGTINNKTAERKQ